MGAASAAKKPEEFLDLALDPGNIAPSSCGWVQPWSRPASRAALFNVMGGEISVAEAGWPALAPADRWDLGTELGKVILDLVAGRCPECQYGWTSELRTGADHDDRGCVRGS